MIDFSQDDANLNVDPSDFIRSLVFRNSNFKTPNPIKGKNRVGFAQNFPMTSEQRASISGVLGSQRSKTNPFTERFNAIQTSKAYAFKRTAKMDPLNSSEGLGKETNPELGTELNENNKSVRNPEGTYSKQTRLPAYTPKARITNDITGVDKQKQILAQIQEQNTNTNNVPSDTSLGEPPPYDDSTLPEKTTTDVAEDLTPEMATSALNADDIADPLNTIAEGVTTGAALAMNTADRQQADNQANQPGIGNQIAAQNTREDSSSRMMSTIVGGNLGSLFGPVGTLTGAVLGGVLGGTNKRNLNTTSGSIDPSSKLANTY